MEENAKVPVLKAALIYGAIVGFISIVVSVLFNLLDLTFKTWASLVSFVILVAIIVYCLRAYRQEYLGGFAEYGKLVLMSLFIGIVSSVLVMIYNYINMTIIDPDALDKMYNFAYNKVINNPRIPEDMVDNVVDKLEGRFTLGRVMIQGFIGGIIMPVIIGVIAAAFLKKEQDAPMV